MTARKLIIRFVTMLAVLVLTASTAYAQIGTPDTFSEDPADLAHLPVSNFDDPALTFSDGMILDGVAYFDGGDYVGNISWMTHGPVYGWNFFTAGWAIPGMDGTSPQFLAGDGMTTIQPVVPSDSIGFRYGAQWAPFEVTVWLSDGSYRVFEPTGSNSGGEFGYTTGLYGWFGYSSGDPNLKIERVSVFSGDRGIDDVQVGYSESNQNGADCSIEGLGAALDEVEMENGLDQRLTTQAMQAVAHLEAGETKKLIKDLEFIEFHLTLESGDKIATEDADMLLECVRALLEELRG